mgnify:FL=1
MIWENLVATSKLIIEYDKIVVGSSLSATIFAFNNNYPLLFTEARRPFRFDYLPSGIDLSFLKIPPSSVDLSTFGERKKVGIAKEILWERLVFLLSLDSKIPLSSLANSAREDGDGQITFFNDYSKIAKIKFNTCYYFGDKGTRGLVKEKTLASKKYICYDWIAFNRGGKHDTDYIKTDDDLVKEVWFYPSDRIDGATLVKDACVVSSLTEEQLRDFNYSETMARFKLVHEMESRGMKGKFNGYGTNGKPKHYKFRTTSTYREKSERGNEYEPQSAYVESPTHCEESLLQGLQEASLDYGRFLKYL